MKARSGWRLGVVLRAVAVLAPLASLSSGCADEGLCTADALVSALAAARPGDTVDMGACRVEAALEVGPGVSLVGRGSAASVLVVPQGEVGVRMTASAETPLAVRLSSLTIESGGHIAVLGRNRPGHEGEGGVSVEDVSLHLVRGAGVVLDGVGRATVRAVTVTGPVSADNESDPVWLRVRSRADFFPGETCDSVGTDCATDGELRAATCASCPALEQVCRCGVWQTIVATHGVALFGVYSATLDGLDVSGVVDVGVAITDTTTMGTIVLSDVTWRGGSAAEILGTGLLARGGITLTLAGVGLERTFEGVRGLPAYGGLFAGVPEDVAAMAPARPTDVRSTGLSVVDNARFGLVHDLVRGSHAMLDAERNGDAAVWLGDADGFELSGATIVGNAFAGVVAADSTDVVVRDSRIESTALATRSVGAFGRVMVGDGVHLARSRSGTRLERVMLRANARTGILVDLGGTTGADLSFTDVTVDGTGSELGAVAGSGAATMPVTLVAGWSDVGIMRLGATAANDAAAAGMTLDLAPTSVPAAPPSPVRIVTPCD